MLSRSTVSVVPLSAFADLEVVVVVDGATYVHQINQATKVQDLQGACNFLLKLIDEAKTSHG